MKNDNNKLYKAFFKVCKILKNLFNHSKLSKNIDLKSSEALLFM